MSQLENPMGSNIFFALPFLRFSNQRASPLFLEIGVCNDSEKFSPPPPPPQVAFLVKIMYHSWPYGYQKVAGEGVLF